MLTGDINPKSTASVVAKDKYQLAKQKAEAMVSLRVRCCVRRCITTADKSSAAIHCSVFSTRSLTLRSHGHTCLPTTAKRTVLAYVVVLATLVTMVVVIVRCLTTMSTFPEWSTRMYLASASEPTCVARDRLYRL